MSLAIRELPTAAQEALLTSLPAHVDPAQLGPEDAFVALWQAGYFIDGAGAWGILRALVRAEMLAQASGQELA